MTAPNIDMIANSLLNCSLNYQNAPRSHSPSSSSSSSSSSSPAAAPPPPPPENDFSITVELNSNVALPFHWEQCLDIRTGQVYYINWENGIRTDTDPRTATFSLSSSDQDSDSDQQIQFHNNICNSSSDESNDESNSSSNINLSSAVSSFSPTESSSSSVGTGTIDGTDTGTVLVAAGCKSCFMYFMIPKFVDVCPKCGGDGLLHLDRA